MYPVIYYTGTLFFSKVQYCTANTSTTPAPEQRDGRDELLPVLLLLPERRPEDLQGPGALPARALLRGEGRRLRAEANRPRRAGAHRAIARVAHLWARLRFL